MSSQQAGFRNMTRLSGFHPCPSVSICGLLLFLFLLSLPLAAAPVVSNVRASQRTDGTGLVDIYYDLAGASASTFVSVVISLDGGASFTVVPSAAALSGDRGTVSSSGSNKRIVWNAGADKPGTYTGQCRARVSASSSGAVTTVYLPGGVPLEMVAIPPGTFQMGANENDVGWQNSDEEPEHMVTIAYGFQMGRFEVTQRQWLAVMGGWPGTAPGSSYGVGDNYPAYNVSWNNIRGANGFIDRLNQHIASTGQGAATFRLPSEAEWEYACRAGSQWRFCFGNSNCSGTYDCTTGRDLADYAWYCGNNSGSAGSPTYGSKPVGGKLPNAFGLYDMHGNVWEWCEDWYHSSYTGAPTDGSAWVSPTGISRVLRGGLWYATPPYCRSAYRSPYYPDSRYLYYGFRLSRTQ